MDSANINSTMSGIAKYKHSLLLVICGVLAPLLLIISVIAGALMTTGYNYISEAICQLALQNSPHPEFTIIGFVTYGLLMIGLAYKLIRSLKPHKYAKIVGLLFVTHGIGFILAGFLRADPTVAHIVRTPTGSLHNISAIVVCLALVFVMFTFARVVSCKAAWRGFAKFSFVVLSLVLAMLFISLLPAAAHIGGLLQRLYSTLPLIWVELVSIRCLL